MKGKLLAATVTVLVGLALTQPAHANITAIATANVAGALNPCTGTDSGTGSLSLSCSGTNFSSLLIDASAPPTAGLHPPDLSTTALTVTSGSGLDFPVTLTIDVTSSGFVFPGGSVTAIGTINNLIGNNPGPYNLSVRGDAGPTFAFPTCTGSCVENLGPAVVGPLTSDSVTYVLTFNHPDESVNGTIEIQASSVVPEPATLGLLGTGLLAGVGFLRRRRG